MTVADAGTTARDAVTTLAMMGAQGTVLALIAFALVRAGRMRPAWQAAIWLVVLAKFALPWGPAMPWSLSDLVASFSSTPAAHTITLAPIAIGPAPEASLAPAIAWIVLALVWALGTSIVLGRSLFAQRAAVIAAHRAVPAPAGARAVLASVARGFRGKRARLVVGDDATGPYVVGIVNPIIVVPPALLAADSLLRAALLHELAHVRRLDAIGRFLQVLASALFFFWPIVRIAGRKLDLAREAACDAAALEATDLPRPTYARLLVKMAELRTAAAPGLASPRSLDARVAAVLGPPVRARMGIGQWIALAAWTAVALGGARSAVARGETEVCEYTPKRAEALRLAHPEADRDGDGYLSKDEACDLQAQWRTEGADQVSTLDADATAESDAERRAELIARLLSEPLCCNCGPGDGLISSPGPAGSVDASCQRVEGVDR